MDEIVEHAWAISIVGDFLTLFGAFWTAHAVLLTPGQAAEIAFGRWDNEPLKNALLKQSGDARIGLVCVAADRASRLSASSSKNSFPEPASTSTPPEKWGS